MEDGELEEKMMVREYSTVELRSRAQKAAV